MARQHPPILCSSFTRTPSAHSPRGPPVIYRWVTNHPESSRLKPRSFTLLAQMQFGKGYVETAGLFSVQHQQQRGLGQPSGSQRTYFQDGCPWFDGCQTPWCPDRTEGMGVSSCPQAVWASSQHRRWVPRVGTSREPGGSYITFYGLITRPPRSKVGDRDTIT